eukprot:gene25058-23464_t
MISEIIIAGTLFVNAGAVLNFKLAKPAESFDFNDAQPTLGEKVRTFLLSLQYFRFMIAIWN